MKKEYYEAKAIKFFKKVSAPEADPQALANWGSKAGDRDLAIVTSKGDVVGTAHRFTIKNADGLQVSYIDDETANKYSLERGLILGMAIGDISRIIGQPVVVAKKTDFTGWINDRC